MQILVTFSLNTEELKSLLYESEYMKIIPQSKTKISGKMKNGHNICEYQNNHAVTAKIVSISSREEN